MKLFMIHYDDVIMGAMASLVTSLTIVYSTVYSGAYQRKHQSSASLAFVWGNHRGPVNSPHKWPVTRKMFPFDDVIMTFTLESRWPYNFYAISFWTHWPPRVTHKTTVKEATLGSDNRSSPNRCQDIMWTNAGSDVNQCWCIVNNTLRNKLHWNL